MAALTDARLGKKALPSLIEGVYSPTLERDLKMFDAYLSVDFAHVVMLAEQKIISQKNAKALLTALFELEKTGPGPLNVDPSMGSLLLQVERFLAEKAGQDAAGVLQLARSRIDQNAAIARVHARDNLLGVIRNVSEFQNVWRLRAAEWTDVLMPGYSHIQHAQPWVLAHYALCQYDVFARDVARLFETYGRTNMNALGGVALAGTSWPINRMRTTELLGHSAPIRNSKDCGGFAMDFIAEVASTLSILMSGLGRCASELYIWSSWEFSLVEIDEGLCGTSSIMPQKKNAYVLERVRALAGESIGWMPSQLGILRTPTTVDNDRFYGSGNIQFFEHTNQALMLMNDCIATLRINRKIMAERASAHWSTASNLADEIVRIKELDFRRSHQIVGVLVKQALEQGKRPDETTSADVDAAAQQILGKPIGLSQAQVSDALDAAQFVQTRTSEGSVGPSEVARMAKLAAQDSENLALRIEAEEKHLENAASQLRKAAQSIINLA